MRTARPIAFVLIIAGVGLAFWLADPLLGVRPVPAPKSASTDADNSSGNSEFDRFFATLGTAAAQKNGAVGADRFDPNRLYREAKLTSDPHGPAQVMDAVWDGFATGWLGTGWGETRVLRVERLPGGAEVIVSARHQTPGGVLPARWWLIRRSGKWRAYDLEDVRVGLRLSDQLAALSAVKANEKESAELETALKALATASAALAHGDNDAAAKALAPARAVPLPAPHRAVLCLTEAAIALGKNDPAAALNWANQADQTRSGILATNLIRAAAFYRQRKWSDAVTAARRYVEALGPDPQACVILGLSLVELGHRTEAADILRAAIAENPGDGRLADALRQVTQP